MSEPLAPEELDEYEDLLDGTEHPWRKRLVGLVALAVLIAAGAYGLFAIVLGGGEQTTAAVQTATVSRGSVTNTVSTTGTVAAQSTTDLSFDQSGRVSGVNVSLGQEVKAGDVLAEIESDDLEDAVTTAEANLSSAQTKLNQLLKGSSESDLASADQSVIQAQANYDQAVRTLEDLADGVSDSERLSAEQAVVSAQATYDQAKLALSDLMASPTDSERIAAEQSVISAQAQLDQANRTLSDLTADPTDSEVLSAEQAVTSAEAQLDQAEASRAQLDSANDDIIAAAESAVKKAENALDNAERTADSADRSLDSAEAALKAEESAYCNIPPASTPSFCPGATAAPISFADEQLLLQVKASGTPATDAAHAGSVLAANTSYENAVATKENADAAVDSAEDDLEAAEADLSEAKSGPSSTDIANADAAVTAAEQAVEAAEAKLDELYEGPTESEQATAEANVDVAQAGLDSANAKLAELYEDPAQSELEKAQDSIESAAIALEVAKAKLAETDEGATDSEIAAAQDNVTTAAASLTVAEAKREDTYAGSEPEDIALQRDQVQLSQLSLKRAQENLDEAKLIAPFDGTVAELNIEVGEVVAGAGGDTAVVLNTPNAVRLELTITESDLPSVEAGQTGFASFDALDATAFPIVIDSVGLNPTATQGVVTYQVRASFLTAPATMTRARLLGSGAAMITMASDILGMTKADLQAALQSGQSLAEIAESQGMSMDDYQAAVAALKDAAAASTNNDGQPAGSESTPASTPAAGAALSAGASTPTAGATPNAGAGAPTAGAAPTTGATVPQLSTDAESTPLPGMNATVTIVVDQVQDVLTVPDGAVQSEGRNSVVEVQNEDGTTETVVVETGLSDGTNTEITSGLEEGQTVIVPGLTTTTEAATTSTDLQQRGFPGLGGAGGGDFAGPPGGVP